jgi:hypothetical protein
MPLPLSQFDRIAALVADRKAALERVERYSRASAFSVFFADDGTSSEPVPEGLVAAFRATLTDYASRELFAVDAALVAAGVDPEA